MAWSYKREEGDFPLIPEGPHRVRIREVEKTQSQKGNDMLKITLDVSGYNSSLFHYIVFMPDNPGMTNRMLTQFFDSFKDIAEGELNTQTWIGRVGACTVKHDEYNGRATAKVGYFIRANKQDSLPPWKEPTRNVNDGRDTGFITVSADPSDDDLPPF